jgi:periplasmic divalent cation tolerance protein
LAKPYSIVIVTAATEEKAEALARAALEARLAACVQLHPIRSLYLWRDRLCDDKETALRFKIRSADFEALRALIRDLHDYETPEILRVEIAEGDADYLGWLEKETTRRAP